MRARTSGHAVVCHRAVVGVYAEVWAGGGVDLAGAVVLERAASVGQADGVIRANKRRRDKTFCAVVNEMAVRIRDTAIENIRAAFRSTLQRTIVLEETTCRVDCTA